jgi:hypothetical protein
MGHRSTRAALIYLHSTGDRQRTLADALGQLAQTGLANNKGKATRSPRRRSGPEVARRRRAPRARIEPPTYRLGGIPARTLCRPATSHVGSKRNSYMHSLPERS